LMPIHGDNRDIITTPFTKKQVCSWLHKFAHSIILALLSR
jgi:hypothetical protein